MNKILKRNTSDEENPRYNVGGFKVVPNIIGVVNVINTTPPNKVNEEMANTTPSGIKTPASRQEIFNDIFLCSVSHKPKIISAKP